MLRKGILIIVLVIALAVVVGGGSPIRPAYVTSDSMSPTIEQGDVFFVVTVEEPDPNDIVTFYSEHRGRLVTHRVVEETKGGYITKGDASETTDQAAGYPPVAEEWVIGVVPRIVGYPLIIPGGAAVLTAIESNRLLVAALLGAFTLAGEYRAQRHRRPRTRTREVLLCKGFLRPLVVTLFIIGLTAIFLGTSTHSLTYVATAIETDASQTVTIGESTVRTITVETYTPPLTTTIIEADGVTILERTVTPSGIELQIEVPPQSDTGVYRAQFQVHPYPATLPRGILYRLHEIHWLLAAIGSTGAVLGPLFVTYFMLLDGNEPLRSPRVRWLRQLGGK